MTTTISRWAAAAVAVAGITATLICPRPLAITHQTVPAKQRSTATVPTVPPSLKTEHEELHEELTRATQAGGRTAEAAAAVAKVLHPHFVKEEQFALPPLGLLAPLAQGRVTSSMKAVLPLTDRLKHELPEMLTEHRAIVGALHKLAQAARAENKPEFVRFAEGLQLHAETEEQVTYPAAILVGEYLKLKLRR